MDRAEAIKKLEWLRMVGNHVDSVTLCKEDMGYFDMALAALREQEQNMSELKHCRYCDPNDGTGVEWDFEDIEVTATLRYGVLTICNCYGDEAEMPINFCPMCGRKLKEGAE